MLALSCIPSTVELNCGFLWYWDNSESGVLEDGSFERQARAKRLLVDQANAQEGVRLETSTHGLLVSATYGAGSEMRRVNAPTRSSISAS